MKQYALVCEESAVPLLSCVFKNLQFVEIQGMDMAGNDQVRLVVTPIIKPKELIAPPDGYVVTDDSE